MLSRVELFERIRRDRRAEPDVPVRELARRHGVHRRTVREALESAVPPPRKKPARTRSLVLEPAVGWIDAMLREDLQSPRKQRHTARRVYDRLVVEYGFTVASYSTVCAYVSRRRPEIVAGAREGRAHVEGTVPQVHEPGAEAEVDFADVWVRLAGEPVRCHLFTLRVSCSGRGCHRPIDRTTGASSQTSVTIARGCVPDVTPRTEPPWMSTRRFPSDTWQAWWSPRSGRCGRQTIPCCRGSWWMRPARRRRRLDAPAPGSVNGRTGKPYLGTGYAPATINHAVAVLSAFYDYHLETGLGPVVSPVPPQSRDGRRVNARHNPLEPFRLHRRGAYRQKQPDRAPRAVPDDVLDDLFAGLACHLKLGVGRADRGRHTQRDEETAAGAYRQLAEITGASGTDWALGAQARSHALLSDGEEAEGLYRQAIARLGRTRARTELARAHLLYGEWLRRARRGPDAREQLRTAHGMLEAIGMEGFAERARRELRATGEAARKRTVATTVELTAREAQIARLAREGLSNRTSHKANTGEYSAIGISEVGPPCHSV